MGRQRHLRLAITCFILGIALAVASSSWYAVGPSSTLTAKAAGSPALIHIPFFTTAVPFNQTAIFWFGDVSPTDNYIDVRIGYNASELYIDLRIVDQYLWYDANAKAPNLAIGDNATVYLNTSPGGSIDQHTYKFQAGATGNVPRNNYQVAFMDNGATWSTANIPFTATFGWRGTGFNGKVDRGWSMTYQLPFSSLGTSGPPPQGAIWNLAVRVHNRDDAANTPIADKWWPAVGSDTDPSSWGDVSFGMPAYQPPTTGNNTSMLIRNGVNNQVVTDGMVGGSLGCGSNVADVWSQLENVSYAGAAHVNIQNESDISDWNCFSKFYITFPLSSLPRGEGIAKATITLYEYGNSGPQGQPNPSYIQVATVGEDWNPATLSWNNAPQVQENITSMLVNTKSQPVVPLPGLAVTWDVSRAVAEAYAAGQPLRLVFYSTDNQYNTGKYFYSSSMASWNANGRPALQVTLGNIIASGTRVPTSTLTAARPGATSTAIALGPAGQSIFPHRPSNDPQALTPPASALLEDRWRWLYIAPLIIVLAALGCLLWRVWRRRIRKKA